ncbi:hypothetical protein SAMN05216371_5372 [Streptomyces sp. TLI_053]|uniref:hypothetical protein n=1 Tax=Streptomyces sp. TLI_053 TaxID=1855352 RepID=UPI00087C4FA7|nr:hypothetical protein [Streptomyces sp. TLI_053]SDT77228.1 hypothetical protein SAMN05216371_5372 [Streptomyces sp. TLI_053]
MIVTGSLVLFLGALIAVLLRHQALKATHLILCGAFGFLLAETGASSLIKHLLAWLTKTLATIHP